MESKIQGRMVLEILGRPASNVIEALNNMIDRMGKEKGTVILERKIHEPVPVKDVQDLFTSFAEIIVECDSLFHFLGIAFGYMPSHVEVLQPDSIELRNEELAMMTNQILARLHNYDAIARRLVVDNSMLKQKLGISTVPQETQAKLQQQEQEQQAEQPKEQLKESQPSATEKKAESGPKKAAKKSKKKKK